MVTENVVFEEPKDLDVKPRTFIQREPGVLSDRLMRLGIVRNVLQAKVVITVVVVGGFMACTYFLESAMSGPDIPPRPPSEAYQEFIKERQARNG